MAFASSNSARTVTREAGQVWRSMEILSLPAEAEDNDPLGRARGDFLWDGDTAYLGTSLSPGCQVIFVRVERSEQNHSLVLSRTVSESASSRLLTGSSISATSARKPASRHRAVEGPLEGRATRGKPRWQHGSNRPSSAHRLPVCEKLGFVHASGPCLFRRLQHCRGGSRLLGDVRFGPKADIVSVRHLIRERNKALGDAYAEGSGARCSSSTNVRCGSLLGTDSIV